MDKSNRNDNRFVPTQPRNGTCTVKSSRSVIAANLPMSLIYMYGFWLGRNKPMEYISQGYLNINADIA